MGGGLDPKRFGSSAHGLFGPELQYLLRILLHYRDWGVLCGRGTLVRSECVGGTGGDGGSEDGGSVRMGGV